MCVYMIPAVVRLTKYVNNVRYEINLTRTQNTAAVVIRKVGRVTVDV